MHAGLDGREIALSITLSPDLPAMRKSVTTASNSSASSSRTASSALEAASTS